MADLLPCPFCGSTNLRYEFAGSQGYIECNECGTEGPCDERAADPYCDDDAACDAWNRRARAALADEPAVPQPQPPAEGEVEELVVELRMMASQAAEACQFTDAENLSRAADLLQRLSPPQPPAEGEVVELVRLLGSMAAEAELADQFHNASVLDWAADLLRRLSPPQPVPVSERPWEREGWCDKRGMCWAWNWGICNWWEWVDSTLISYSSEDYTHCLPAHALPIPQQQQENTNG